MKPGRFKPREKPMPRSRTPIERAPMKRGKKRSAAEFARIHGSSERVEWINAMPCYGCGVEGWTANAHVCGNGGASRKADADTIAPLCKDRPGVVGCHTKYDQHKAPFHTEAARERVMAVARRIAVEWDARQRGAA